MSTSLFQGTIRKMISDATHPIDYYLSLERDIVHLNQWIEHPLQIRFLHYNCLNCHEDKEIFRMGHCKQCYYQSPSTAEWVIRPELSKAHLDQEDRDLAYEKQVQLQPHIVYLAYTSKLKVGVTRLSQVPTRWIDQGATQSITMLKVPNRYLAGVAEVVLKKKLGDKTNWREMLKDQKENILDLVVEKQKYMDSLPDSMQPYITKDSPVRLEYPVNYYPPKINAIRLSRNKIFRGLLKGIKGQYLIFEDGNVLNVRNHEGYVVSLER